MTKKQREDISKLLYDLVKLTYTGFIIGSVISPKGLNTLHVILGISLSMVFLLSVSGFPERMNNMDPLSLF